MEAVCSKALKKEADTVAEKEAKERALASNTMCQNDAAVANVPTAVF